MQFHAGKEYQNKALHKKDLNQNPVISLNEWIDEAKNSGIEDYNAFHLSTADKNGSISGRIVLMKAIINEKIIFFTDYSSRKGKQINDNNLVAATFYWGKLERQIRIEGTIAKTLNEINDQYFSERPKESQAAAIASNQSQKIENRKALELKYKEVINSETQLKRPSNWGGYEITPNYIEFWQGRPSRLNDRVLFSRQSKEWNVTRLAP
jgi:pyridoxamine 5'-phosphate oxidase